MLNFFWDSEMYFLCEQEPEKVSWRISEQTAAIIQEYAAYVDTEEHHVVDIFLKSLLADPNFPNHLRRKRNYKCIVDKVFFGDKEMKLPV